MHNHVTVIPADNTISVNGEGLNFDFIAPENMHALQWHDGTGHIEYTDGQGGGSRPYPTSATQTQKINTVAAGVFRTGVYN